MHRFVTCCVVLLAGLLPAKFVAAAEWKAAAAKVNITPKTFMWMSGYGGRSRPAEGKLTDLWAKALAIEDAAGNRGVLVTMDLVGIDRGISSRVCRILASKHKLRREQIILSTTHTHTGPVVGDNLRAMYSFNNDQQRLVDSYTKQLEKDLVAVVDEALKKLAPAKITWGQGTATFAVNRRNNREGSVPDLRTAGKLKGPADHDVPVLVVRDKEDKITAIVCGYACHATVLSFYKWSGDWPGFAQIALEKAHPGAIALVWAGCGADQNPLPRRKVELAEKYGQQLAAAVERVIDGTMKPLGGKLSSTYKEIDLSFDKLPTREALEKNAQGSNRYEAGRAKRLLAQWDKNGRLSPSYPYPVQTWRLGDGPRWVVLGGEVVVDFSLRLKAELGKQNTWVAGYSNDVMAYIPSRRVWNEGGYEGGGAMLYYGLPSRWAPGVEKRVVDEVHRQVKQLGR